EKTIYFSIDNQTAPIIRKIKSSSDYRKNVSALDLVALEHFFCHMYWRNPANDTFVKELVRMKPLAELGISYGTEEDDIFDDRIEKAFRGNPDFFKYIKASLPMSLYHLAH